MSITEQDLAEAAARIGFNIGHYEGLHLIKNKPENSADLVEEIVKSARKVLSRCYQDELYMDLILEEVETLRNMWS